ncbi:endoplasmin homolog [Aricia agestis]|uniref:endoplasmin homolog n=1 Tax=Aricia agestis TaxID=91739 RepID=UPI001C204678|nr:endoplasmin homolog [Aricia agestis]XP_041975932.1 endoplasmin homolog [Aricia agestis]XP_041975933.1 endoplasmin homolog [Aricia agestis]
MKHLVWIGVAVLLCSGWSSAQESVGVGSVEEVTVDADLGASREGSRTDAEAVLREEEAISPDGLSVAQQRELKARAQNYTFQTEVNRMMKLIINSLYRNKEIFLRELISNGSDALDKIRLLSLTDREVLAAQPDLSIRIKADAENRLLHIIDTGVGMTRADLVNNLGTIAKSGTADFLARLQDADGAAGDTGDMIGQFGVGFYSAFLVADRVTVVSKHNDDVQHVWDSDANSFSVAEDPRGNTLGRGTHITLHLKEEAADFLQPDTIRGLVRKYSQFINFPIYLWASRTETVEEPVEPAADADDDDAQVEDADDKETRKTEKTVWEWEVMNDNKPIWTRKPAEVSDEEYTSFYKSLTKDTAAPLARAHFVAEGEVTFRALLFVPRTQPADSFNRYGAHTDHIKLYVRRVFITDEFNDLMPNYLAFIQGIVDSDDLPLNVSRETLQQHKLIKIIKKKLVRKALDMLKKISDDEYEHFWKEYSTNIKLGVMEDPSNRSRLAKLLRFHSSHGPDMTSLEAYVSRMRPGQHHIYYVAGTGRAEVERSPFAERLVRAGREVLYLTEPVDEYCLSALPEYDGHKFQNIAKEIFDLDEGEQKKEELEQFRAEFEPLTKWLGDKLGALITRAGVSRRLARSPAALVATAFGWTGNMERLAMSNAHQKADDAQRKHHLSQKKMLEINPRHPVIRELLRRVTADPDDPRAAAAARTLYRTAALRSGYMLQEGQAIEFADAVEAMLQADLGLPADAQPELEDVADVDADAGDGDDTAAPEDADADHDEL